MVWGRQVLAVLAASTAMERLVDRWPGYSGWGAGPRYWANVKRKRPGKRKVWRHRQAGAGKGRGRG